MAACIICYLLHLFTIDHFILNTILTKDARNKCIVINYIVAAFNPRSVTK